MRPSLNRLDYAQCEFLRWDEESDVHIQRFPQKEWPLLRSEKHIRDRQGESFRALLQCQWGLRLGAIQRYGNIRPNRSRDSSRNPIPRNLREQRAGLLRAKLCFLANRGTGLGVLPLRAFAL